MDVTLAGSSITYEPDDDQLGRVSIELAAMDGEIGYGQLPVNDALAAIDVATGRACRINETNARIVDGFIVDHDRDRGPLPAGTAREYVYSVADPNAILEGFRVVRSRPSETDYARVIAFAALDLGLWNVDTTWVLSASSVTLPAKSYSGTGWSELVTDLVEFTGKTLFVHDKAFGGYCLHYHLLTSGHTSTLTISDVPSAVNGTTVFAPQSPTRTKTSMDLRNDIMGRDQAGRTATATDTTSIATHDADGLQHQEIYDFEAVSQSDLNVKTAALLASLKEDTITYRCTIGPLDGTALTKIRVGDYITTTSSVMGLTASAQRISHMTLTPHSPASSGLGWNAALELGAPIRRRARVKPYIRQVVPSPGTVSPPSTFVPGCVYNGQIFDDFNRTVVAGAGTASGGSVWINVTTPGGSDYGVNGSHLFCGLAGGTFEIRTPTGAWTTTNKLQFRTRFYFHQDAGVFANFEGFQVHLTDGTNTLGWQWSLNGTAFTLFSGTSSTPYTFPSSWGALDYSGIPRYFWVAWEVDVSTGDITGKIWLEAEGEPGAYQVTMPGASIVPLTGTVNLHVYMSSAFANRAGYYDILYLSPCTAAQPMFGQEFRAIIGTGDGVTTAFTVPYAYMTGIRAYVNDLPEFSFTETSSTVITFSSPPFAGEIVTVEGKGA